MGLPYLQSAERFSHGTRSRYVGARCRCDLCREANRVYYHARRALERERLAELDEPPPAPPIEVTDGRGRRLYKRACPGLDSDQGCPFLTYLRKDSKRGLCLRCRAELVADYLVDARPAKRWIRRLSRKGIGYKSVADAASVARTNVQRILRGDKVQIRLSTERRILAVDAGAARGGSVVDARPTWRLIRLLLKEGFSKHRLALRLGCKSGALQFGREKITARNALRVAKFYRAIMAEA